jgi:hypothetical protein
MNTDQYRQHTQDVQIKPYEVTEVFTTVPIIDLERIRTIDHYIFGILYSSEVIPPEEVSLVYAMHGNN